MSSYGNLDQNLSLYKYVNRTNTESRKVKGNELKNVHEGLVEFLNLIEMKRR